MVGFDLGKWLAKLLHLLTSFRDISRLLEDESAIDTHLKSLNVMTVSVSKPEPERRPFDFSKDVHFREATHASVRGMLVVFRRQMVVLSVSLSEEIYREFLLELFLQRPRAMHQYLRNEKLMSPGFVSLKDVVDEPTREALLHRLAVRATDTALAGGTIKRVPRIERLTGRSFDPSLVQRLDAIENLRHNIVHRAREPAVTEKDCEEALELVHELLCSLGNLAKSVPLRYSDPAFLVDEPPPAPDSSRMPDLSVASDAIGLHDPSNQVVK